MGAALNLLGPVAAHRVRNLPTRVRGINAEMARLLQRAGFAMITSELSLTVRRASGKVEHYGVVSRRVVTSAGVNYLVDAWQNLTELENFNYHAIGTGTNAEATGDTALQTESALARIAGTTSEPAANQFRTSAEFTATGALAVTEHGIFSASSTGTLWDRSVFSAVNLANGDKITTQYTLTVGAGG